jgi:8-oxo-dGTP pyrophosphatase MutT (NUDIX family)
MREVKGFFRNFNGKRVWVPEHDDKRAAAAPEPLKNAPKQLKPINPGPVPVIKNPDDKIHHHPDQPWKDNHFGTTKPGAWSEPFKAPNKYGKVSETPAQPAPKKPWVWHKEDHSQAPLLPKLTHEEKLDLFLKNNPHAKLHPKKDEHGNDAYIREPSQATGDDTWKDKDAIATFLPGGDAPKTLNKVKLAPWTDHPTTDEAWAEVDGQDPWLDEPALDAKKAPAAGVIIEEPDGRIWIIHPSNGFGGYRATFPKGHVDADDPLQATAIREAFEESGLKVQITGWLMDVERSTTTARYYTAKRVGGTPSDCGWETQAVSLVPRSLLYNVLHKDPDYGLAEALGAGPAPKPKWTIPLPKGTSSGDFTEPANWWEELGF